MVRGDALRSSERGERGERGIGGQGVSGGTEKGTRAIAIAPSILAADFRRLGEQVSDALAAGVRRIHIDVMDGRFVPNISMGALVVEALRPLAEPLGAVLEVHLMIEEPDRYLADFHRAGARAMTVHVEACPHLHRTVQSIRALDAQPGVGLNPATPLGTLDEILPDIDVALIMSVNPGFGGQKFIASSIEKVARLRADAGAARSRSRRHRGRRRRVGGQHRGARRGRHDDRRRRLDRLQRARIGRREREPAALVVRGARLRDLLTPRQRKDHACRA